MKDSTDFVIDLTDNSIKKLDISLPKDVLKISFPYYL
jgi:hypothetical protein